MGAMDEIVVPVGYDLSWKGPAVPRTMKNHISHAAKGMKEASEIGHLFGRSAKPFAPMLLIGPDGRTPIVVIGDGMTEAAELEDLAMEAIGHQQEQMDALGRGLDYDDMRERHGKVMREQVDTQIREAIRARIKHHQQNPVTDPFRQPRKALGNVFPMSRAAGWVDGLERNTASV